MKVRRRTAVMTVGLLASGALAACTGSSGDGDGGGTAGDGGDTTLQYAFYGPGGTHAGQQMDEWAAQVEERTGGRIVVETFPGGTLLGTGDIFDGVTEGIVDVGLDSPHNDATRFPLSSVLTVPLGITNAQVGSAVYMDLIAEFQPAEFDGFHIMTAFTAEPSFIQSVAPIESYTDIANAEMRVPGSTVSLAEALGYVPVGLPIPEVAQALETNVVDGYISSRDVLRDFGLAESISTVINYPFGLAGTFVAVMTAEDVAALSDDDQAVLEALSGEMSQFAATYQDDVSVAGALEHAKSEYGVEFIEPTTEDTAAFDAVTAQVQREWVEANASEDFDAQAVLDRTLELVAEHSVG